MVSAVGLGTNESSLHKGLSNWFGPNFMAKELVDDLGGSVFVKDSWIMSTHMEQNGHLWRVGVSGNSKCVYILTLVNLTKIVAIIYGS